MFIIFVGACLFILLNIGNFGEDYKSELLVVVFSFVIFIVFRQLGKHESYWGKVKKKLSKLFGDKKTYRSSYVQFLFTWLILVSIFPTIVFFRSTKRVKNILLAFKSVYRIVYPVNH